MAKRKKQIWTVDVKEDNNGDAVIEFPDDLLATVGWQEGDEITWQDLGDGSWSLRKKDSEVEDDSWDDIFKNGHRDKPAAETRVSVTRETIMDLHRLMQATDLDSVELVVSHGSGIGPAVRFSYHGEIDATNYGEW
jgi:hypothetical protein